MDFRGEPGIIAQHIDDHGHIDVARFKNGLAVIQSLHFGEFINVLFDKIGELPDQSSAFAGGKLTPCAARIFEGLPGGGYCAIHVIGGSLSNLREHFCRGRIDGIEHLRSLEPLPVNQQATRLDLHFARCEHSSSSTRDCLPHFALKFAGRFSTYAARPSLASSLWNKSCWFSRSTARADSIGISHPVCTARLMRPTAFAALFGGQNCRAYSMIFSMKPSRSKMSFTMPSSCASSNEKVLPVTISSMALLFPTSRESRCVPPVPGRTPRFTSGNPILPASLRAIRMSAAMAISSPPPTQCPLMAAITSLGVCSKRSNISLAWRQK